MNNKYSVACITLVRDKYKINTDCICVVYTADSIRKFDSKSNRTADSIRDSIRTQKNDSQVPSPNRDRDKRNSPTNSNWLLLAGGELSDDELEVSVQ